MRGLISRALIMSGAVLAAGSIWLSGANLSPTFRVDVNMVTLSLTVTDDEGHYVDGLKPDNFRVTEDGVPQRIRAFAEARKAMRLSDTKSAGSSIFVLFDTSNCMYAGFSYAEDAIADFIRRLPPSDAVAVYSFSRNLTRQATLTHDHMQAIRKLRDTVAGDDTALLNALLLTIRDAEKVPGRKMIVVFSNGPDNASMLAPDDVRRAAEDEGIPIYVVSTKDDNPIMNAVFSRLTGGSGGKYYSARQWQAQADAFSHIREEIANSYTIAYYPEGNENTGFRKIDVQILGDSGKNYHVRTRQGYRPHQLSREPIRVALAGLDVQK